MPPSEQLLLRITIKQSEYLTYRLIRASIFWNYNLISILSGKFVLDYRHIIFECKWMWYKKSNDPYFALYLSLTIDCHKPIWTILENESLFDWPLKFYIDHWWMTYKRFRKNLLYFYCVKLFFSFKISMQNILLY